MLYFHLELGEFGEYTGVVFSFRIRRVWGIHWWCIFYFCSQEYDEEEEEESGRPKKKKRKGALGFIIDEAGECP